MATSKNESAKNRRNGLLIAVIGAVALVWTAYAQGCFSKKEETQGISITTGSGDSATHTVTATQNNNSNNNSNNTTVDNSTNAPVTRVTNNPTIIIKPFQRKLTKPDKDRIENALDSLLDKSVGIKVSYPNSNGEAEAYANEIKEFVFSMGFGNIYYGFYVGDFTDVGTFKIENGSGPTRGGKDIIVLRAK